MITHGRIEAKPAAAGDLGSWRRTGLRSSYPRDNLSLSPHCNNAFIRWLVNNRSSVQRKSMAATVLVVEDEPAIQELIAYNLETGRPSAAARRQRRTSPAPGAGSAARPRAARLDAARTVRYRAGATAARRQAHQDHPDHHADGAGRRAGQAHRPRHRRRRLHHQTLLAARAECARQGRAAPTRAADDRRPRAGELAAPGPGDPSRERAMANRCILDPPSFVCCTFS